MTFCDCKTQQNVIGSYEKSLEVLDELQNTQNIAR